MADLQSDAISTEYLVRSDRLTTLAVVTLKDGQATYTFYDENSAGRMVTFEDMPVLSKDVSTLYFGGLSLVAEPAAKAYADLLEREAEHRVIMLDPNIRANIITDEPAYRKRLSRLIKHSDIVKVSDDDLNWIDGSGDLEAMAERPLAQGVKIVILSRGGDGASCFSARGRCDVPAPKTTVIDTVGAGDTFNAGLLAALDSAGSLRKGKLAQLQLDALKAAAIYAAQAAAVTVSRVGANPPYLGEL